jgi:hypothetical protein
MDGSAPPRPSTGWKSLDEFNAHCDSEEHQRYLAEKAERYRPHVQIEGGGVTNLWMRREYGTYRGKP